MNDPSQALKSRKTRLEALEEAYGTHGGRIINGAQYIGYGILIALFYFSKEKFFVRHEVLSLLTSLSAIIFLLLLYMYTAYLFVASQNALVLHKKLTSKNPYKDYDDVFEEKYQRIRTISLRIFWTFLTTLVIAVILFMISSFCYFWGEPCQTELFESSSIFEGLRDRSEK